MASSFPGEYLLVYPWADDPLGALKQQLRIADRAVEIGRWPRVRIFSSPQTACVVVTHLDLDAVKNPHVTEWADTFTEVDRAALLSREDSGCLGASVCATNGWRGCKCEPNRARREAP